MDYTLFQYFVEAKIEPKDIPEWFGKVILRHPEIPDFRPRWEQILDLNLLFIHSRKGLWNEQGTGKTLPAQAYMIYNAAVGNKALGILPPILLDQFEDDFYVTFENIRDYVKFEIYYGPPPERRAMAARWKADPPQIVLTSIAMFRDEWKVLHEADFGVVVCDEAKYLSNPETKMRGAVDRYLGEYGNRDIVAMTGTPARNNLANLYGFIDLITPWVYRNKADFYKQHVIQVEIPIRYKVKGELVERKQLVIEGFRNTEVLRHNLMLQSRRVRQKDVLSLAEPNFISREFYLNAEHRRRYEEFCRAEFIEFPDGTALSGEQTATKRAVARQAVMRPDIMKLDEESAVLQHIEELLDEIDVEANHVMIGAYYQKTVELIAHKFSQYNPAVIYGGNTTIKNQKEAERFKKDKECKLSVMNYESGGYGLNFQMGHYAICAEPTTVPGDFDQWIKRMQRSGQKHTVICYLLKPRSTIFITDLQKMFKKESVNNSVMTAKSLRDELLGK